jgi:hypothetical protein
MYLLFLKSLTPRHKLISCSSLFFVSKLFYSMLITSYSINIHSEFLLKYIIIKKKSCCTFIFEDSIFTFHQHTIFDTPNNLNYNSFESHCLCFFIIQLLLTSAAIFSIDADASISSMPVLSVAILCLHKIS